MRRCSSAACAPCCCSRCIRWRWPGWPSTPDYRGDPWGRLQRTSEFLAVTTFGTADDAQRAVDKVRRDPSPGPRVAPTVGPTALTPPPAGVGHIAEIDSFLLAHRLYGDKPLDQAGRDGYVADTARVATALGVIDPPRTEAELRERIEQVPSELRTTPAARDAARFLLVTPRCRSLRGRLRRDRGDVGVDAAGMARLPLRLPYLPPGRPPRSGWPGGCWWEDPLGDVVAAAARVRGQPGLRSIDSALRSPCES